MARDYSISDINVRFSQLLRETGLTQKELGALLGVSSQQVSNIVLGKRGVTDMIVELLKYKLDVNDVWLRTGEGSMFQPQAETSLVPLYTAIPAGLPETWPTARTQHSGMQFFPSFNVRSRDAFALVMPDDSMAPTINRGDILIIDPHRDFRQGIAAVRHRETTSIRNVRRLDDRSLLLIPQNPSCPQERVTPLESTRLFVPVKIVSVRELA